MILDFKLPQNVMAGTACISCTQTILPHQHAITCDVCQRYQHRTCNTGFTGIPLQQYREKLHKEEKVYFICHPCEQQNWPETKPGCLYPYQAIPQQHRAEPEEETDQLNKSFDIDIDYEGRPEPDDTFINAEPCLPDQFQPDVPVTFKVLEQGSKRGCPLLISSNGYSYCLKKHTQISTFWRCSVRSKKLTCPATISQRGDSFKSGRKPHVHPADYGIPVKAVLTSQVKEQILRHPYSPASHVVSHVVSNTIPAELRSLIPNLSNLKRTANRLRAQAKSMLSAEHAEL